MQQKCSTTFGLLWINDKGVCRTTLAKTGLKYVFVCSKTFRLLWISDKDVCRTTFAKTGLKYVFLRNIYKSFEDSFLQMIKKKKSAAKIYEVPS